jgi:hypothetical protein
MYFYPWSPSQRSLHVPFHIMYGEWTWNRSLVTEWWVGGQNCWGAEVWGLERKKKRQLCWNVWGRICFVFESGEWTYLCWSLLKLSRSHFTLFWTAISNCHRDAYWYRSYTHNSDLCAHVLYNTSSEFTLKLVVENCTNNNPCVSRCM